VDRDRIIHAEAFRDLQHKTQVQGIAHAAEGPGFRTRLNHVIEVAQIAAGIAVEIGADRSLSEAIALAHDLGHPPFGHAGERALRNALRAHGEETWNANVHSLAVVDEVECSFISFRGLDLTWATREGIARHSTPFDEPVSFGEFAGSVNAGLECQVVDAADVLAYLSHDLDDALADGFLDLEDLAGLSAWLDELLETVDQDWREGSSAWPPQERPRLTRRVLVAKLIGASIRDVGETTRSLIASLGLETATDVRGSGKRAVAHSQEFAELTTSLLRLLSEGYYRSDAVGQMDAMAERTVQALFDWYFEHPTEIDERFRTDGPAIAAATFIASLNDRSATVEAETRGLLPETFGPSQPAQRSGSQRVSRRHG